MGILYLEAFNKFFLGGKKHIGMTKFTQNYHKYDAQKDANCIIMLLTKNTFTRRLHYLCTAVNSKQY